MRSVSNGSESGRMKYLIVEPRMLTVSRVRVSRCLGVILTFRSAVFICGDTEEMVPEIMVPGGGKELVRGASLHAR